MLAAAWLAEGWDSPELVELAAMTQVEARAGARRMLASVLDSLGVNRPYAVEEEGAARYAALVAWAVRAMDGPYVPYSAGQKVLEAVDDDPATLANMPGVASLASRLRDVDASKVEDRDAAQAAVRAVLVDIARQLGVGR